MAAIAILGAAPAASPGQPERSAAIEGVAGPAEMMAGRTYRARLLIRNTGTLTWAESTAVRLSYHWLDAGGRLLVRDGVRTRFTTPVPPGDVADVCATVEAPARTGRLVLAWDLVQEGVSWFARDDRGLRSERVTVAGSPDEASDRGVRPGILVWFTFFAATVGHFLLASFWTRLSPRATPDPDERRLQGMTLGLGWLMAVLYLLSVAGRLSIGWGLATLAASHAAAGLWISRRRRDGQGAVDRADGIHESRPTSDLSVWTGWAALAAIALQWMTVSSVSTRVTGTDAAHYHVPHAVNFANGAGPFDLLASPHPYPMGTSMLAAWLMLPAGDPLFIDLATLPAFVLLVFALALIIRLASGLAGLGWAVVLALLLLTTPLVKLSLLMSAELFYAAAFAACLALLARLWLDDARRPLDGVALGAALGLLVGSKATGVFSAVALLGLYGAAAAIRRVAARRRIRATRMGMATLAAALAAAVLAGGIWQIRNTVRFGSPIAPSGLNIFGATVVEGQPYEGSMYYLSVRGDLRDSEDYDLAARVAHYTRLWLGAWYLPSLGLVAFLVLDVAVQRLRRRPPTPTARARIAVILSILALGAVHAVVLAGAPWTSLEWTRGLSLRYLMPFVVLLPAAAACALFLDAAPWHRRQPVRDPVFLVTIGAALLWLARNPRMAGLPPAEWFARFEPVSAAVGVAIVALAALAAGGTRSRQASGGAGLVLSAALALSVATARERHDALRAEARSVFEQERYCTPAAARLLPQRGIYYVVERHAARAGGSPGGKRIFLASRFDLPLELQDPAFTNVVFDVRGRNVFPGLLERAGPRERLRDYVIASTADVESLGEGELGARLRADRPLEPVGEFGGFSAFTPR